jgi:hypothetical protein
MNQLAERSGAWFLPLMLALCTCEADQEANPSLTNAGTPPASGGAATAGASAGGGQSGAQSSGGAVSGASAVAGNGGGGMSGASGSGGSAGSAPDPCDTALLCEKFDDYAGVMAIAHDQEFGPWRAEVKAGTSLRLDGTHTKSGTSALHVQLDEALPAGGQLIAGGNHLLFDGGPTHVYGRLMMYIAANGPSVHWTFFSVKGDAEPASPEAGEYAHYLLSSLPRNDVNTYSFVHGLQASDGFRDCSQRSDTAMPSDWACISFELDSVARKLRMYKDGAPEPILAIDDHGNACVPPTPITEPWYGPTITQVVVGAWSFHPMKAPLEVWIDDVIVDTKPVSCPAN